jgi:hypothetical protein
MLQPERQVSIHQGNQPTNVVDQTGAGSRKATGIGKTTNQPDEIFSPREWIIRDGCEHDQRTLVESSGTRFSGDTNCTTCHEQL